MGFPLPTLHWPSWSHKTEALLPTGATTNAGPSSCHYCCKAQPLLEHQAAVIEVGEGECVRACMGMLVCV